MSAFLRRLIYVLGRSRHDADLRDEIELHRAHRQDALERDGLAPVEAHQEPAVGLEDSHRRHDYPESDDGGQRPRRTRQSEPLKGPQAGRILAALIRHLREPARVVARRGSRTSLQGRRSP